MSSKEATSVYTDYSPVFTDAEGRFISHPLLPTPNWHGHQVVVIEGGEKASDAIAFARRNDLTTRDADGNEIFWIVFSNEPRRVWEFTGKALRQTIWIDRNRKGR